MHGIGYSQHYTPRSYGHYNRGGYGHNHGYGHHHGYGTHSHNYTSTYRASTGRHRGGFTIDLNGDGYRNSRGTDGVLAFDLNGNGRISKKEIRKSRRRLQYLTGTHKDLRSKSPCKRARAKRIRKKLLKRYDVNRDGRVSKFELQRKGARVLVDSNRNGRFESYESQSLGNIRTDAGSFRLNALSSRRGGASVTSFGHQPSWGHYSHHGYGGHYGGY